MSEYVEFNHHCRIAIKGENILIYQLDNFKLYRLNLTAAIIYKIIYDKKKVLLNDIINDDSLISIGLDKEEIASTIKLFIGFLVVSIQ